MDALAEATKALVKAKEELFKQDMHLKWKMEIEYIDSARIKAMCPPRQEEGEAT